MHKISKCKSVWEKPWQKAITAVGLTALFLSPFLISPQMIEPLFITGHEDKLFHAVFFGLLACLILSKKNLLPPMISLILLFGLGLSIEALQGLLPHRGACLYDIIANGTGMGIAAYFKLRLT
ncbi:VanZ family protein [Terasakiella sp. SH-1]|uniref:VanZ family protein n=1 Tax=Terasakiella sp. SH-1 TaxID=2560057 RepID=UPI0010739C9D|nr:VanZ family protein [Terasakiella sp. SH-1]